MSGRPVKRPHPELDCAVQKKCGQKEHVKRKHDLPKNELNNQAQYWSSLTVVQGADCGKRDSLSSLPSGSCKSD